MGALAPVACAGSVLALRKDKDDQVIDALMVARFMFERNARDFAVDEEQIESVWRTQPEVQAFWLAEATAVLGFIGFAEATR